jgi:hypothetical protein
MKLIDNLTSIILEASKKKILIDKVGLSAENAEMMDRIAGPLSVWLANKFIERHQERNGVSKEEALNRINSLSLSTAMNAMTSIMDWIRVGLDGNVKPFMTLTFDELYKKSREWHDSLEVGQGDINYVEDNPIILDFRNENGDGFYWADLETSNSPEECERMGHCGRSSLGYLYSLREVKTLSPKFKLNKSHLTAAISPDGVIYQMKGPKNSKPQSKYHKYIIDLFCLTDEDGEYFIKKFGSEYEVSNDFNLFDLSEEEMAKLLEDRPDLFNQGYVKYKLRMANKIKPDDFPLSKVLNIGLDEIHNLVNGLDIKKIQTQKKVGDKIETWYRYENPAEKIVNHDFEYWSDYVDIEAFFNYVSDSKTDQIIRSILIENAKQKGITISEEEDGDLYELFQEHDDNGDIENAIRWGVLDAEQSYVNNVFYDRLKSSLSVFGQVKELTDEGLKLEVDLIDPLKSLDNDIVIELFDNNYNSTDGLNFDSMFWEIVKETDYYDKETFDFEVYPDPSKQDINELVRANL